MDAARGCFVSGNETPSCGFFPLDHHDGDVVALRHVLGEVPHGGEQRLTNLLGGVDVPLGVHHLGLGLLLRLLPHGLLLAHHPSQRVDDEVAVTDDAEDLVRKDMMLHFGAFITESSGHLSEYLPYYRTNKKLLEIAEFKLEMLKEDSLKMRAKDLHELLRAWENYHRIMSAEAHMKHIQFREETRYPGFYYHMDYNYIDDENWKCFSNSTYDKKTKKWTLKKVPYVQMIK